MQRSIDLVWSNQNFERKPKPKLERTPDSFKGEELKRKFSSFLFANLGKDFADWTNIFPNDMYTQLSSLQFTALLNESSRQNHWDYELNMINSVIKSREAIFSFFGVSGDAQADFLKELIFMITISDIGKAGPVLYDRYKQESVAARIYNNLILELEHAELLKSIDLNNPPPELVDLIADMKSTYLARIPSLKDDIFTSGFFLFAPIELALYLGKIVLNGKIPRSKRGLRAQVKYNFSLTPKETQHLISLGFDPRKTSIGTFYSNYHIVAGEEFLMNEIKLPVGYQYLVQLGLCHHFSQGVRPRSLVEYDELLSNERNFKIVAFLEILDKVEAAFNRSREQKSEEAIDKVLKEKIVPAIQKNYPPEQVDFMIRVYTEVFLAMKEMKIFEKL